MEEDYWMGRALEMGRHGVGLTSPNPPVGAVLVKDGKEIGSGFHHGPGQAHAEVEAVKAARIAWGPEAVKGATLYVTLEPCSTRGRTGPCTEVIMRVGISRVVYGATDPNPAHVGAAESILGEAGIEVSKGVRQDDCALLIRPYAKVQTTGLPWIIAKTAMSLDGRITRPPGEGAWLSSPSSRSDVQMLRVEADAILTSGKTVRADNPRLTIRPEFLPQGKNQPWRVVLSSRKDGVPAEALLRTDEFADRTLIFQGRHLDGVFRELAVDYGVQTILVESGGRLLGRLVDEGWVDEVVVYLAPLVTGGADLAFAGEGVADFAARLKLFNTEFTRIENDVRLRGVLTVDSIPSIG